MLSAEILDGNNNGPTRVAFHFDRDLTDPSLRFLTWDGTDLLPAALPAPGDTLYLTRFLGPAGF